MTEENDIPKREDEKKPDVKPLAALASCSVFRDVAIEGATVRLLQLLEPAICGAAIQKRGQTEIHEGAYTISLDGEPVFHIELDGSRRFSLTILSAGRAVTTPLNAP